MLANTTLACRSSFAVYSRRHLAEAAAIVERYQARARLQAANKEESRGYLHSKVRMLAQTVFVLQVYLSFARLYHL
jgi:hypothetical protein